MIPFDVVGIGPGQQDLLTVRACNIISSADVVVGARRAISCLDFLLSPRAGEVELVYFQGNRTEVFHRIRARGPRQRWCVVVTGDTGFHSLLAGITKQFSVDDYRVCPGISCVQIAAARMGTPWQDALHYSMHGRFPGEEVAFYVSALLSGKKLFVLTDKVRNPLFFAGILKKEKVPLPDVEFTLFFNLGYADEEIMVTGHRELSVVYGPREAKLCLMLVSMRRSGREKGAGSC